MHEMRILFLCLLFLLFSLGHGQNCDPGSYLLNNVTCAVCPTGYYCVGGAGAAKQPCSAGAFNDQTNQTDSSSCISCTAGTFSSTAGVESCTPCAAGTFCSLGSTTQQSCNPGQYSIQGSAFCTLCPSGYSCSDPAQPPQLCPIGKWSSAGKPVCEDCPAGSECEDRMSTTPCPPGTSSALGASSCTACGPGYFASSDGQPSCSACPAGFMCASPNQSPTQCSPGYISGANSTSCTICPSNQVAAVDQQSCMDCPAGYSCSNPIYGEVGCPSGTYSLLGDAICQPCPAGSACTSTASVPSACPSNTFSSTGQTVCTQCPAGYSCSANSTTICVAGTYSVLSDSTCHDCPSGSRCPQGSAGPIACTTGSYSPAKASKCTSCLPGHSCPNTATQLACASGTYSAGGLTTCLPCAAGSSCISTMMVGGGNCSLGQYYDSATSTCTACPKGSYCPSPDLPAQVCTAGQYTETTGMYYCKECPPGSECPNQDQPPTPCNDGYYSTGGPDGCNPCTAGNYCPYRDQAVQLPCPPGSYAVAASAFCTVCPAGSQCPSPTSAGSGCPKGSYSLGSATACLQCPAGYACPSTNSTSDIIRCTSGSYSIAGSWECTSCPPGNACPFTNQATTIPCTSGFMSAGNRSSCVRCRAGFYCPDADVETENPCPEGEYSLGGKAACEQCELGFYCPNTTIAPIQCPRGYYADSMNSIECTGCPAGKSCNDPAAPPVDCMIGTWASNASTICRPCELGYICPALSPTPNPSDHLCNAGKYCDGAKEYDCPIGTYNSKNGSGSLQDCVACPAGYCCELPATVDPVADDLKCAVGHYCPIGTGTCTTLPCPGGTYNPNTGAAVITDCTNNTCPAGSYCPQGTSDPTANECPQGFYCVAGQITEFENPCPPGTYGDQTGLKASGDCAACTVGHYCPWGSGASPTTAPIPCPSGTYNPLTNASDVLSCVECDRGTVCQTPGLGQPSDNCAPGYYCPLGTISPTQFACPPGSHSNATDLYSADQCEACPAGYYCSYGTSGFGLPNEPQPCKQGYYCPVGTPSKDRYPCLPGTYSNNSHNVEPSDCDVCDPGFYCVGGESAVTQPCPPGYYCPNGTVSKEQFACPNSTYNPLYQKSSIDDCLPCTQGHFCEIATVDPALCPDGTYMPYGASTSNASAVVGTPAGGASDCIDCPAGSRCINGAIDFQPCGVGFYTKPRNSQCQKCLAGYYCDEDATSYQMMVDTKQCPAGQYCMEGLDSVNKSKDCRTGYYCPEATPVEVPCPTGTLNPLVARPSIQDCKPCTAGHFCLEASTTVSGDCEAGYYCPTNINNTFLPSDLTLIGSFGPRQIPCPGGRYRTTTIGTVVDDCTICPAGSYCPLASVNPLNCPQGYYCYSGVDSPSPCPKGTYGTRNKLTNVTECTDCDPGYYCDSLGMINVRGECDAGYLCFGAASTSNPNDNTTGIECPVGGYCPMGSYNSTPCPPGSFSNKPRQTDDSDCQPCIAGFYCANSAQPEPTGPCAEGHYCTQGSSSKYQNACQPGTFCKEQSTVETQCPIGTFNPNTSSSRCRACTPGRTCPYEGMNITLSCPQGSYCPSPNPFVNFTYNETYTDFVGTFTLLGELCPPGTYNANSDSPTIASCLPCPVGQYCSSNGLKAPENNCSAGYICYNGSNVAQPSQDNTTGHGVDISVGQQCAKGKYCPEATTIMLDCPQGTYNPNLGAQSKADCIQCDPGKYCAGEGQTGITGPCDVGYYCSAGAFKPDPKDISLEGGNLCPVQHYCNCSSEGGCAAPTPCDTGLYTNQTGQSECLNCEPGFICIVNQPPAPCGAGYYCVGTVGTGGDRVLETIPVPCPAGSYSNRTGLKSPSECTDCDAGMYCLGRGNTQPDGPVDPKFYSAGAAQTSQPGACVGVSGTTYSCGQCQPGFYCSGGKGQMQQCPAGTYGPSDPIAFNSNCIPCTPGYFCEDVGKPSVTAKCSPGYYCTGSSEVPNPTSTWGGICSMGHYCEEGAIMETPCKAGTYANHTGMAACDTCPEGYYCPLASVQPLECEKGYYCPNETADYRSNPCPKGTYSNTVGATSSSTCLECIGGSFCETPGSLAPTDLCSAGWYCTGSAYEAKPTNISVGGKCPAGTYCPIGSVVPKPCDPGTYCATPGLPAPSGNCSAGFFCTNSSVSDQPSGTDDTGGPCKAGHYCPEGSSVGTACPPSTYAPGEQGRSIMDCLECDEGKYCGGYGLPTPTNDCDPGYYCPPGQNISAPPQYVCWAGYFCVGGSKTPSICGNGTYQNEERQSVCKVCPAGYYCDASSGAVLTYNNTKCPKGYYCPEGTGLYTEHPCDRGSYNPVEGGTNTSACSLCDGGHYCPDIAQIETRPSDVCAPGFFCKQGAISSTPNQGPDGDQCPQGFYCPISTTNPIPCPPGSYGQFLELQSMNQCTSCNPGMYCGEFNLTSPSGPCSPGYYCPGNSTEPTEIECEAGHYCGNATSVPDLCPEGTYTNLTRRTSVNDCLTCTGGKYCESQGLHEPTGDCTPGYFCPPGSIYGQTNSTYCTAGTYCPGGTEEALPCEDGTYVNWTHAEFCPPCPEGFTCTGAAGITTCPEGYYCPAGTGSNLQACPRGTFSNVTGLKNISECQPCPGGNFCKDPAMTNTSGPCSAGFYCIAGMDRSKPDGVNSTLVDQWCYDGQQTGYGGRCTLGHYCPQESSFPKPCDPGSYAATVGQDKCDPCVAGYYCPAATVNYTDYPCPSGHYCPPSTSFATQYECGPGTFNNATTKTGLGDCLPCTGGWYCNSTGLSLPTYECPPGYFCPGSSVSGTENDCPVGSICPAGSVQPTICPSGYFCDSPNQHNVSGSCQAGWYCRLGAVVANPEDGNITGNWCPKGSFCPSGSGSPTPCPPGTYLDSIKNVNESNCKECSPGSFCDEFGLEEPTGECAEGFYCEGLEGQRIDTATPAMYVCPQGHYCMNGSIQASRCDSGFYQDEFGKAQCKLCEEGYFCDNTMAPVVIYNSSSICPSGYYCPPGTKHAEDNPCPAGKFYNSTRATSESDCIACTGGMYCDQTGLPEPRGPCVEGYFCTSGSNSSAPVDNPGFYGRCPPGYYCGVGTVVPKSCPPGYYNPSYGGANISACLACSDGRYCPEYNMVTDGLPCLEGYYCPSGSSNASSLCPQGYYCPVGQSTPVDCPPGTWSDQYGLTNESSCLSCLAGYYCPSSHQTKVVDECQGGYYCVEGQNNTFDNICPRGMHCPNGSAIYQECTAGTYTDAEGQSECAPCLAGFYCLPVRPENASDNIKECPAGYYCLAGTGSNTTWWQPCPSGTYSNGTGLATSDECKYCKEGYYCEGTANKEPTAECDPGHYCTYGVDRSNPGNGTTSYIDTASNCSCCGGTNSGVGGICPRGYKCPRGSRTPVECPAGSYAPNQGLDLCTTCVEGFFCPQRSYEYTTNPCPVGHYCPSGTEFSKQFKCPAGTYNPVENAVSQADCLPCGKGEYCSTDGLSASDGNCSAGFYCTGNSTTPTPVDSIEGSNCPAGFYCPEGTHAPLPCPSGYYCPTANLTMYTDPCSPGYYCFQNATLATPDDGVTGWRCKPGRYCPQGTTVPLLCPNGTFSGDYLNKQESDCDACTAGRACTASGLESPNVNCTAGYYCPGGDSTPESTPCERGYYCPTGSDNQQKCGSGTYQDETLAFECKVCPEGFACDGSSNPVINPTPCPEGHFCPNGTKYGKEFACPIGTFNNGTGLAASTQCHSCLPKYACTIIGLVYPSVKCAAGYFCRHSANSSTPSQGPTVADVCPPGYYCTEGTDEPTACPEGTYSSLTTLGAETQCSNCTAGMYCSPPARLAPTAPCDPGYYCPSGSFNSKQVVCPAGSYCGEGTATPDPCPSATFSPTEGLANSSQCTICPAGSYCETMGATNITGPCTPGYFCPNGSSSATEVPCWIGYKCPLGSAQPQSCGDGFYSDSPLSDTCVPCPAGQYCEASHVVADVPSTLYRPCPRGYYCPNGTGVDYKPCPIGTYSNTEELQRMEECLPCSAGYYCNETGLTSPTAPCDEGYYCQSAVHTPNPSGSACAPIPNAIYPSLGDICPTGTFCVAGSKSPLSCIAGFYNDITTQGSCRVCEPGYYCPANTTTYLINPCPEGYYCPSGTERPTQYSCKAGTFNNMTKAHNESWCVPCSAGTYCDNLANTEDGLPCDPGYYCPEGSTSNTGTPNGGECFINHYCPAGTPYPIQCPAGQYCERAGLPEPTNNCTKAYYCPPGSAQPLDPAWACEPGFYCPEGTTTPIPCPNGTYGLVGSAISSFGQCQTCDAGSYCSGLARTNVSGSCDAGYFCPAGSTSPNDPANQCMAGYKCPTGSATAVECNSGYYQKDVLQPTCLDCPAGFYCPTSGAITTPIPCPEGHYCLLNTDVSTKYPCPSGTYNNNTGSSSAASCKDCWPGYFCSTPGHSMGTGDGPCEAGYYCTAGSDSSTQNLCPQGFYCEENSYIASPCPPGSITKDQGNRNVSDCESCDPGKYCSDVSGVMIDCLQGYVCTGGSDTPTPLVGSGMGYICPAGFMCTNGTLAPTECSPGTYQPKKGQYTCEPCPPGTYCPDVNTTAPLDCPAGYFCELSTSTLSACPDGTFSNKTNLNQSSQCEPCPAGKFCKAPETDPYSPSKDCSEGYVCVAGSDSAVNLVTDANGNGPCPVGHYCPRGTPGALECPPGSMRAAVGGRNLSDCAPCPATKYCEGPAASTYTGACDAGFYCPSDAFISSSKPTGYECTPGHFCPAGSAQPQPCTAGSYEPFTTAAVCQACPAGFYCQTNATTPIPCPVSSYCVENSSSPAKCPPGYYGSQMELASASQCETCISGSYCVDGTITALCSAGYYCISGSPTPTPDGSQPTQGSPCPFGYYCEEGTTDPKLCPDGLVINVVGASSVNNCTVCPAGFICANGTVPVPCNPGFYCPFGGTITPCPPGTYSNTTGASDGSTCGACVAGYWCPTEATTNSMQTPCPVGHYCPLGTGGTPSTNDTLEPIPCQAGTYRDQVGAASQTDCATCAAGFYCPFSATTCYNCTDSGVRGYPCPPQTYCPSGSVFYQSCEAGYYCPQSSVQLPCPAGNYCPMNSSSPIPCPQGNYCPTGTPTAEKCPLGYQEVDGSSRTTFDGTCQPCQPGTFGADENRQTCTTCQAGVVCLSAATTDQPQANNLTSNITNSYPCPPGYYCPAGSTAPTPCPPGTYNPNEFGQDATSLYCALCAVDQFNHLEGQIACFDCGGMASQPSLGQTSCVCTGSGQDFQPSDRQCPCADGYQIDISRGGDCVKYVYPICTSGTSRSQSGQCLTDEQWLTECISTCGSQELYQGVDKSLGACLCTVDDLDSICDLECRTKQKQTIQLVCPNPLLGQEVYIRVTNNDGTTTDYPTSQLSKVINAQFSISMDQCTSGVAGTQSVYMMESAVNGMLGLYQPDPTFVASQLEANSQNTTISSRKRRSIYTGGYETSWIGRKTLAVSTISNSSGIENPVTCLEYNSVMFFTVSSTSFPVYDSDNLYNTNENFDYGGFRKLQEDVQLIGSTSTLFAFRFRDPGVYVFEVSSNSFKKTYIKVMPQGGTCTEVGPFFPGTPRYMTQSGLSLRSDILLEPDWLLIGLLLASAFLLILILVGALVLFQKYGWGRLLLLVPYYREIANFFDFDNYSSKGSSVHSVKKLHPNIDHPNQDVDLKDEFWDHERQVDLEAFSSQELYSILKNHSNHITSSIGRQKEEVKLVYQKISQQIQLLKDFWRAKLNVLGKVATKKQMEAYEKEREDLDIEIERRKLLGQKVTVLLNQQRVLLKEDLECREKSSVEFSSTFSSAKRLVISSLDALKEGSWNNEDIQMSVASKVDDMIHKMSMMIDVESRRLGCWGVLGDGTGGQLVHPDTKAALTWDEIFNADGSIKATNLCNMDPILNMAVPKHGCELLLANGQLMSIVDKECFIHPQTGKVLPIEGSLCFDPVSSQIICTVDFASSGTATGETLIPFVPHPGAHVELPVLGNRNELRYGKPMVDPHTGLNVPICGVTIHPGTGQLHPVGGAFKSPVTGLPTPIEIGSFMLDPHLKTPVPIITVGFDNNGKVVPIGGTMVAPDAPSSSNQVAILPGAEYREPMSGKVVPVGSCRVLSTPNGDGRVVATNGGNQPMLDAGVLACRVKSLDALRQLRDMVYDSDAQSVTLNAQHELLKLEESVKSLNNAHKVCGLQLIRSSILLNGHEKKYSLLAGTGGVAGIREFQETGQLLPILIGTTMQDPHGTKLNLPILGVHKDNISGLIRPLAGTMEHPDGLGLVPIQIGVDGIDIISGKTGKVTGAKVNVESDTVTPVICGCEVRPGPPAGAVAMLEDEIASRNGFWRKSRGVEADLVRGVVGLQKKLQADRVVENIDEDMESIASWVRQITNLHSKEVDRREARTQELRNILPPDVISILTGNDEVEMSREEISIGNFSKLSSSEQWVQHIEAQIQSIETDTAGLEYTRSVSDSMAQEARRVLKTSSQIYGESDVVFAGATSDAGQATSWNALSPLMRQLISLLESGMEFQLTPELLSAMKDPQRAAQMVQVMNRIQPAPQQAQIMHAHPAYAKPVHMESALREERNVQRAVPQEVKIQEASIGVGARSEMRIDGVVTPQLHQDVLSKSSSVKQSENKVDSVQEMMERQAMEIAKLENELRSYEISKINEIITDIEQKKETEITRLKNELKEKLKLCTTDEEKEQVMLEYASKIHKVAETLETEKQNRLSSLRRKLAKERQRRKKDLHLKHIREAQQAGLDPDEVVVDIAQESEEEVNKDLLLLAQQQEKLLAELQLAYAHDDDEDNDERRAKLDAQMEERIRALNQGRTVPVVSEGDMEELVELGKTDKIQSLRANMKDKMKKRRAQRRPTRTNLPTEFEGESEGLSAESELYKANLLQLQSTEDEHLEDVILSALKEAELERCEMQQARLLEMKMNESGLDEKERDLILAEYKSANERFKSNLDQQQSKQKAELLRRLKARKALQEEISREQAVAKQLQKVGGGVAMHEPASQVVVDSALVDQQVNALSTLEDSHDDELDKLSVDLEEENKKEELELNANFDEQCQLQISAAVERAKQQALDDNLNDKRTAKLIKQYQAQAESLNNSLSAQKKRQIDEMREKLKQRKDGRKKQLVEKQKIEKDELMLALKDERNELASEEIRKSEAELLNQAAKDGSEISALETFVQATLLPRQLMEMTNLVEKIESEIAAARTKAQIEATSERETAREKLTAQYADEVSQLLVNHAGEPANKVLKLKKKLEAKHKEELKAFDNASESAMKDSVRAALTKVEVKHAESKLKLRENHLMELSDALQRFNPEQMLMQQYADESSSAAKEAQAFKERKRLEIDTKIQQLKEERRKARNEANEKIIDQELLEDMTEISQKEVHSKQEADKKEREILASNLSGDEKERLLKEHRQNVKKIEDNLSAEKARVKKKLEEQLAARRKKRLQSSSATSIGSSGSAASEHSLDRKSTEELRMTKDEETLDGHHLADIESVDAHIDGKPHGASWTVMVQNFAQELDVLEAKLRAGFNKGNMKGATSSPFIDLNDAQWLLDGSLATMDVSKLNPSQYIIYKFGMFVVDLLQPALNINDRVAVVLARNVPANNYHNNAFRNSFFYKHADHTLYIRAEHLTSVGDFIMVLVHCLSHISVGQMDNDSDPYFLRAFYKALKIACEDLFFARARSANKSPILPVVRGDGKDLSLSILDNLMDTDTLHGFTDKSFADRVIKYGSFQNSATISKKLESRSFENQQVATKKMLQLAKPQQHVDALMQAEAQRALIPRDAKMVIQQQVVRLYNELDQLQAQFMDCINSQNAIQDHLKQTNEAEDQKLSEKKIFNMEARKDHLTDQIRRTEMKIQEKLRASK